MAAKEYDLDQPMDKLIDLAVNKFGEVEFQDVSVGGDPFKVLQIKHMQRYIDKLMDKTRSGKTVALPLWAKLWPADMVMAHSLSKFPLADGASVLEIGGGSALAGLTLARRGCEVTVTDTDPDALLFARINALKNDLGEKVRVVPSDFKASLGSRFDCVVGCELLYDEPLFDLLAGFIDGHLAEGEGGEVFLSLDLKRAARNFFHASGELFKIMKSTATFKDGESGEDKPVNLFRFMRK
ncbi:methyltransferase [Pseudodesulfovibrio cashew]|uniref:Methyltransferase n=1 Tax=Pseudodesulfovibrio cashew TaxID=2678688 RepID=A0A6I6JDR9_9BACT|nr:methyltransferase [Pseudodesulfovibrio cashew]QGY40996.1 methyltransferase [Pseudodesulfovibrio cashew]